MPEAPAICGFKITNALKLLLHKVYRSLLQTAEQIISNLSETRIFFFRVVMLFLKD